MLLCCFIKLLWGSKGLKFHQRTSGYYILSDHLTLIEKNVVWNLRHMYSRFTHTHIHTEKTHSVGENEKWGLKVRWCRIYSGEGGMWGAGAGSCACSHTTVQCFLFLLWSFFFPFHFCFFLNITITNMTEIAIMTMTANIMDMSTIYTATQIQPVFPQAEQNHMDKLAWYVPHCGISGLPRNSQKTKRSI